MNNPNKSIGKKTSHAVRCRIEIARLLKRFINIRQLGIAMIHIPNGKITKVILILSGCDKNTNICGKV